MPEKFPFTYMESKHIDKILKRLADSEIGLLKTDVVKEFYDGNSKKYDLMFRELIGYDKKIAAGTETRIYATEHTLRLLSSGGLRWLFVKTSIRNWSPTIAVVLTVIGGLTSLVRGC